VAAAVDRALAKKPADRFPSMEAFGAELAACLEEVRLGEGGEQTGVLGPPEAARMRPRARTAAAAAEPASPQRRRHLSIPLVLVAVGVAVVAAVLALALTRGHGSGNGANAGTNGGGGGTPVALRGAASWDPPPGDGEEHAADVHNATDGNPATYWSTESYRYPDGGLGKPGVGVVLDAGRTVTLQQVTVASDTPGFTAVIQAGDGVGGPFHDVSDPKTVESRTTFDLNDAHGRYFVVWITDLGNNSRAHVNEVTAG
jgi:hypothetical protein